MMPVDGERVANLVALVAKYPAVHEALLPMLHEVQASFGCVDAEAEAVLAAVLNLSRAEVHGVVSFYHDFTSRADPRPCLELCQAEACKARGGDMLIAAAKSSAAERVKIKTVYCLGLCSAGPAARVDDALYARLDEASITYLVKSL